MRVHLQGLGVTGSLIARLLEAAGVDFTWHDSEAERVSWRAATGTIYPCGDAPGKADYERWAELLSSTFRREKWWEIANYWYNHKHPPHKGRFPARYRTDGGLALSPVPSLHINSQALVEESRAKYAALRREKEEAGADYLIVSHGFNSRMTFAYWGWSCLVRLEHALKEGGRRPCLYLREGRFIMAYAYPVPGREEAWYAGSAFLRQAPSKMRSLATLPKYEQWQTNFERLAGGEARVRERLAEPVEGWRPANGNKEDEDTSVLREGKVLTVPPLKGSGIRRFPSVWAGLTELIFPPERGGV